MTPKDSTHTYLHFFFLTKPTETFLLLLCVNKSLQNYEFVQNYSEP